MLETFACRFLCGHKCSAPQSKYRGVRLLSRMVTICLVLQEAAKLSSKLAVPFCISTSDVWEFLLLHIYIQISFILSDPLGSNNLDLFLVHIWLHFFFDPLWIYWLYLDQFPSLDPSFLRIQCSSTSIDPHRLCVGKILPLRTVENCCFVEFPLHIEILGMIFQDHGQLHS